MKTTLHFMLTCVAAIVCLPMAMAAPEQTLPPVDEPFAAPAFTLKDMDGKVHRLEDYRGKVVVLNFWATWCPPCRKEMPSMERARQEVADEPIVILAINVGEDVDTIFQFTANYPVQFPLLLDRQGKVIEDYPVVGLPTTYIIDPHGRVTHRAVGDRDWDDPALLNQLRALLQKD